MWLERPWEGPRTVRTQSGYSLETEGPCTLWLKNVAGSPLEGLHRAPPTLYGYMRRASLRSPEEEVEFAQARWVAGEAVAEVLQQRVELIKHQPICHPPPRSIGTLWLSPWGRSPWELWLELGMFLERNWRTKALTRHMWYLGNSWF